MTELQQAEAERRVRAVQDGRTDIERWSDPGSYEPSWSARGAVVAAMCEPGQAVCDIGCGQQTLRGHLPPGTLYLPADLRAWTDEVELCELNAGVLPERSLARCDIAVMLGVLEYIRDPAALLAALASRVGTVVVSYNCADFAQVDRAALGWVNALTEAELLAMLDAAAFDVVRASRFNQNELIVLARSRAFHDDQPASEQLGRAPRKVDAADQSVAYWMQGGAVQNFGDFLSKYFTQNLFFAQSDLGQSLRIIGSCIDDAFVPPANQRDPDRQPVFWGCGLRTEDGLSLDRREGVEFLAVRGPLSRSALRLGNAVPIGDPGLLMPALHKAARALREPTGASLLVPHFHDRRPDSELLAISGCDAILRPNIVNDLDAVSEFVDQLVAASFVLAGSLHAAIVAAAYDRPFGFWDSGAIDLPFKWADFAASLSIPCVFHPDLPAARAHYDRAIAPSVSIPPLWPLLVAAPLPVRPDAFVSVVELDVRRHGADALRAGASSRAANRLQTRLQDILFDATHATRFRAELIRIRRAETDLRARIDALTGTEQNLTGELAAAAERLQEQEQQAAGLREQLAHGKAREAEARAHEADRVEPDREIARLRAREAWLAGEEARLHEAVQHRDRANAGLLAALQQSAASEAAMRRSLSWRLGAPIRAMGGLAVVRRLMRLAWWAITLQLARRLAERRRVRREIAYLAASPLFDAMHYRATCPDAAASGMDDVRHYVLFGAAKGCDPNPLFDSRWYRQTYAVDLADGGTAFGHYLSTGAAAGHDPHPLFQTAHYVVHTPGCGAGSDALLHYQRNGGSPNRLFDPKAYRSEYADARASGLDPLMHYIRHGAALGLDPHPLFDTAWYCVTYPEVRESGLSPLAHYLRVGALKGYDCTRLLREIDGFSLDRALALPEPADPEASIVIPTYGRYFDTLRCLHAIMAHSGGLVGFETILIDDDPSNPLAPLLADVPGLRIERNLENLGFLRSCNVAARLARGWHIIFLNNDTLVRPDWLEPLLAPVRRDPRVGMVGCKLLNTDGTLQEAGGIMFSDGWGHSFGEGDDPAKPEYNYLRSVDVVVGAAFLVRRELFEAVGGFDDRYAPAFYEEFDLAFKIRAAGHDVVYQPRSEVVHLGSTSYGPEVRDRQSLRNHAQFCLKWESELASQPEPNGDLFGSRQRPDDIGTILMIDDKVPEYDRHAGALTVFQYIGLLVRLGFRIVYWPADATAREPYAARLQDMGVEVLYAPATLPEWLRANGHHLRAVWTARPDVTAPLLALLRKMTDAPILYYPHDLHHLREMRHYRLTGDLDALARSHRLRRIELAIFRDVDWVMTPSDEEARVIGDIAPSARVRVIPPYLYPQGAAQSLDAATLEARSDILFVGGFKHPPNADAAIWLVETIMPLVWQKAPAAKVLIVGDTPTERIAGLASSRVDIIGHVPDLVPWFARARLSAAPLRYGAGVKGKIVSSLQAGVPVVTTAIGNEGIALADGTEALLGETAQELADAIVRLTRDAGLCAALSAAGAAVVGHRFDDERARVALSEILGLDFCRVCGNARFGDADSVGAQGADWSEHVACERCHATNCGEFLADALIAPFRSHRAGSLRAAVPLLARSRMHQFGPGDAVTAELRKCPLFTESDSADGSLRRGLDELSRVPGSFDLILIRREFEQAADAELALLDVLGGLTPGGRCVFTASGEPGREFIGMLRQTGLDVHVREHRPDDARGNSVALIVARKPLNASA